MACATALQLPRRVRVHGTATYFTFGPLESCFSRCQPKARAGWQRSPFSQSSSRVVSARKPRNAALASIGFAGGFAGALCGLGGGFVVIPLLTGFAKVTQHAAHATSLAAIVATSVGGCASYAQNNHVDFEAVLPLSAGAMLTAALGAKASSLLNAHRLKRTLGVFMIVVAPLVLCKDAILKWSAQARKEENFTPKPWVQSLILFSLGSLTGFSSGLFGVGGGAIMVPSLALSTDLSQHTIIGTSLAAMALPSVSGALQHFRMGHLSPITALPVALGTLAGSFVGGKASAFLPDHELKLIFAAIMTVLGCRSAFR
mmetsp:Transcript_14901/g.26624  ORF Transcript_14901/g.26624 Transcript_14901/m.26624 type:complete len:315 (+) Transcript_14901:148-1092(+)